MDGLPYFQIATRVAAQHSLNISVLQALSKAHLFYQYTLPQPLLDALSKELSLKGEYTAPFFDFLNLLLFNVCALNEQLMFQMEQEFLESTGDRQEAAHLSKDKHHNVKAKVQSWLSGFVTVPFVQVLLNENSLQTAEKMSSLRQLIETIDYLLGKYQVETPLRARVALLVKNLSQSTLPLGSQAVREVNKTVFCSGNALSGFMETLSSNQAIGVEDVAQLISANFEEVTPPRAIFKSTDITGAALVEQVIDFLVRKVHKSQLFSEKMENYRPFELLSEVIFQQSASLILEWSCLVLEGGGSPFDQDSIMQRLGTLLKVYLPSEYPRLHLLLKYTYSSLLAKYSSQDSLQLIKKLVLNRILLNPSFFAVLLGPSEQQMDSFVAGANSLRQLFYQKKAHSIQQKNPSKRILELHKMLENSLKSMLGGKEVSQPGLGCKDRGVYINDKLLLKTFAQVSDGLKGYHHETGSKHQAAPKSEVSLSFSLRNQSKGAIQTSSREKSQRKRDQPSIPKPSRPEVDHYSQNSKQREENTLPDVDKLSWLIELRREFGRLKRESLQRAEERRERRDRVFGQLQCLTENMREGRERCRKRGGGGRAEGC